jgi:RNase P subunit RPR2
MQKEMSKNAQAQAGLPSQEEAREPARSIADNKPPEEMECDELSDFFNPKVDGKKTLDKVGLILLSSVYDVTYSSAFQTAPSIEKSRMNLRGKSDSPLNCQLCPATLRRVATLRRHYISQHHYEPTQALMFEEKAKESSEPQSSVVSPEQTWTCKECSETFTDKNVMIKHISYSHVGHAVTTFRCKHCDKSYRYERDLKTHQERLCKVVLGQFQVSMTKAITLIGHNPHQSIF